MMEIYNFFTFQVIAASVIILSLVCRCDGQYSKDYEGEVEDKVDKYRFQYHDEANILLTIEGDRCYVTDVDTGSTLQETLNDVTRRKIYYEHLVPIIKSGVDLTKSSLDEIHKQYQDDLLRAMCFRSKIFKLQLHNHV